MDWRFSAVSSKLCMAPFAESRIEFVFFIRSEISRGGSVRIVSPSLTFGDCFDPNAISTYLSPTNPSDLIAATESFLTTSRVAVFRFMTTRTFPSGPGGSSLRFTVPSWIPLTRTSAPSVRPATFSKSAFKVYVELKRNRLLPIQKIPAPKMRNVAIMKAPSRNALDIITPPSCFE